MSGQFKANVVVNSDDLIFLRDPLAVHPHKPDVSALLRVCDVHNVPPATKLATAEAVLRLLFEYPEALEENYAKPGSDVDLTAALR
jgi:methylglyoxal synthase